MAITKSGTRITFTEQVGQGDTWDNAITLDDIYDAAVAGGWAADFRKDGASFVTSCSLYNTAGCYVDFYNASLTFVGTPDDGDIINNPIGGYWRIGTATPTGVVTGCSILHNCTAGKDFSFYGYSFIYDSIFNSVDGRNYWLRLGGDSLVPKEVKRCIIANSQYAAYGNYTNVIYDYNTIIASAYGIFYNNEFRSIKGLRSIGRTNSIINVDGILTAEGWNVDGAIQVRAYFTQHPILRLIDGKASWVILNAIYGISDVGAKAQVDNISTFNINITGGENAPVTIYDKNDTEVFSGNLDASGSLTDEQIKFRERSQEKTEAGIVNVDEYYHPFKVKVTKSGYQDLEIPDITVTAGQPTTVFGKMEEVAFSDGELEMAVEEDDYMIEIQEDNFELILEE